MAELMANEVLVPLFVFLFATNFLVVSMVSAQAPRPEKDERAVREVIKAYADAREQRDPKRLSAILAPDADQLVSSGEWRRGRDELVRGMLQSSERNSGGRTIQVETVRFIAPDVAIADARYEIAGEQGAQARRMWSVFIVSRANDAWLIHGIRNMLPTGSR